MSRLLCVIFLAFPLAASAQQNEAEKLFNAFEQKLAGTKAWSVEVKAVFADVWEHKGALTLADGSKVNLSDKAKQLKNKEAAEVSVSIIADGQKIRFDRSERLAAPRLRDNHPELTAYVNRQFSHLGFDHTATALEKFVLINLNFRADEPALSEFKSVGKEKIGGREANVIEYAAQLRPTKLACKLWLDAETKLPLKRSNVKLNGKGGKGGPSPTVENYTDWNLAPVLKVDEFKLPK